jgi:hypothetical protein
LNVAFTLRLQLEAEDTNGKQLNSGVYFAIVQLEQKAGCQRTLPMETLQSLHGEMI